MNKDAVFPTTYTPEWGRGERIERRTTIACTVLSPLLWTYFLLAWPGGPANGVLFAPTTFYGVPAFQGSTWLISGVAGLLAVGFAIVLWPYDRKWQYYSAQSYIRDVRNHPFRLLVSGNATVARNVRRAYGSQVSLGPGDPADPTAKFADATITPSDGESWASCVIEPGKSEQLFSDAAVQAGADKALDSLTSA